MVRTWHREGEYSSGTLKIFLILIHVSSFFIVSSEPHSGYFWQFTDIHWDQQYSTHGDPGQMCHRKQTESTSNSGQPEFSSHMTAGRYGTYSCDAPWDLVEHSINHMAQRNVIPDFIIWTGDNTPHVKDPEPDWPVVFSSLRNVTSLLKSRFPHTIIIPVLGNHDVFPEDFYPSTISTFYNAYLIEGGWSELLNDSAKETFGKCGFYSVKVKSDLQVIVLNTNLYNVPDNLTRGEDDPCGQFSWLEQKLQLAKANDYKILLAAHIPPGYFERWIGPPFFNEAQNDHYVQLIHQYGSVLMTHVYGHTHTDSFRIFASDSSQVKSVAFVSPSVTPWLHEGGVNPSLRLYEFNKDNIKDYWQYYLDLKSVSHSTAVEYADNDHERIPKWDLLYQATVAYNVPDLSAPSVLSIYKNMLTNDSVFNQYYYHNTVGHVFKKCDAPCMRDHICAISHLYIRDMQTCLDGDHVLFRNDPELAEKFAEIAKNAKYSQFEYSLIISMVLTAVIIAILLAIFAYKKYGPALQREYKLLSDKSGYCSINRNVV